MRLITPLSRRRRSWRDNRFGVIPGRQNIDSWRGPLFFVMARLDRATRRGTVSLRVARSGAGGP